MTAELVLDLPAALFDPPVARPDGGRLHPLRTATPGPTAAGIAIDASPDRPTDTPADAGARELDREPTTLAGRPAVRTLTLAAEAGVEVVVERWRVALADGAVTVTATADLARWAALAEPLRRAVATARLADTDTAR